MAVSIELHNTGDPSIEPEIRALAEHHLSDRPGDWADVDRWFSAE
jgi:hypothetical protein